MNHINVDQATGFANSGSSGVVNSKASLGKDDFLKLLSIQLQYQNPLDPMDNTQFIAQMAQFSSLEGITNMSVSLNNMSEQIISMNNLSTTDLIGRNVKVYGDEISLVAGENAKIDYLLHRAASDVEISILDSNGNTVRTVTVGSKEAGVNSFVWDGTDDFGNVSPPGSYSVSINAGTEDGARVTARPISTNLVEGVIYENGIPYLMINGSMVSLNDILEVWGN